MSSCGEFLFTAGLNGNLKQWIIGEGRLEFVKDFGRICGSGGCDFVSVDLGI